MLYNNPRINSRKFSCLKKKKYNIPNMNVITLTTSPVLICSSSFLKKYVKNVIAKKLAKCDMCAILSPCIGYIKPDISANIPIQPTTSIGNGIPIIKYVK